VRAGLYDAKVDWRRRPARGRRPWAGRPILRLSTL